MKPKISAKDKAIIKEINSQWETSALESRIAEAHTRLPSNWEDIRDRILRQDRHRCIVCGNKVKLTIHHRDGDETNNKKANLITVCQDCHDNFPVPPFSERFYCKTIVHDWYHPICLRLGRRFGDLGPENCPFHSARHGCILVSTKVLPVDGALVYNHTEKAKTQVISQGGPNHKSSRLTNLPEKEIANVGKREAPGQDSILHQGHEGMEEMVVEEGEPQVPVVPKDMPTDGQGDPSKVPSI